MAESLDDVRSKFAEWRHRLDKPWLIAAWPGMGAVAQLAATYLAQQLHAQHIAELPDDGFFDLPAVEVERGLILPRRVRHNPLLGWKSQAAGGDLVLFVGEAQPEHGAARFCEGLVGVAHELGAVRVCTFAAMATLIRPDAPPRVMAAASDVQLLDEVRRLGAEPLAEGSIGGLNGLLIEVAARHGIPGVCLLGEMPYFANAIPNPKAAAAVLRTLSRLAHVDLDLAPLDAQAAIVERNLVEHLKRTENVAASPPPPTPNNEPQLPARQASTAASREREAKARIEDLFEQARRDRQRATELKAELDRQGLFRDYQDRFLDLFKRAE